MVTWILHEGVRRLKNTNNSFLAFIITQITKNHFSTDTYCLTKECKKGILKPALVAVPLISDQLSMYFPRFTINIASLNISSFPPPHWSKNGQYPDNAFKGFPLSFIFSCKKYPKIKTYQPQLKTQTFNDDRKLFYTANCKKTSSIRTTMRPIECWIFLNFLEFCWIFLNFK